MLNEVQSLSRLSAITKVQKLDNLLSTMEKRRSFAFFLNLILIADGFVVEMLKFIRDIESSLTEKPKEKKKSVNRKIRRTLRGSKLTV